MSDAYTIVSIHGPELNGEWLNLIRARWMRSLRYGNDYFRLMIPENFYRSYQRYIDGLLERPETWVSFAGLSDDPQILLGFSVWRKTTQGEVLDYVHVHKDQRRQGIARHLIPRGVHTITHLTRTGLTIWGSKCPDWRFDPFA